MFSRIPEYFDFFFWLLDLNRRLHTHDDLFNTYLLSAMFGCPKTNFWSLSRGQPHSPDINHCVFIIFWLKIHWKPHNNDSLKNWNGLKTDSQTHRLTDTWANWWTKKSKNLKRKQHCLFSVLVPQIQSICIIH